MTDTPLHRKIKNASGLNLSDFDDVLKDNYINAQGDGGATPLMCCITDYGQKDSDIYKKLIKELLKREADPRIRDCTGRTALHRAAESLRDKQEWVIDLLMENGADINAKDNNGNTPLLSSLKFLSSTSRDSVISRILSYTKKIDVANNEGLTPLILAVQNGRLCSCSKNTITQLLKKRRIKKKRIPLPLR